MASNYTNDRSQSKYNSELQEPCVQLTNVHRIDRVSRHLDDILLEWAAEIGNILYMCTYRRSQHDRPTTTVMIQLQNWSKHKTLIDLFNGLDFHGYNIIAKEFYFNFQFHDNEYQPRGIGCTQCIRSTKYNNTRSSLNFGRYFLQTPPNSNKRSREDSTDTIAWDTSTNTKYYRAENRRVTQLKPIILDSDNSNDSYYSLIVKQEPVEQLEKVVL